MHNSKIPLPRILAAAPGWPVVFELDEGESIDLPAAGGRMRSVRLIAVRHSTEPDWWVPENESRQIVARAEVLVEIDGEPATLFCRPYELPRELGGLRLYVEASRGWAGTPQYQPLANIERSVRFSCVPAGSPWGPPMRFPIDGFRWRCSTYQNSWNALVPYNQLYYHRGEDFGAIPDRLSVVAPAAGRIVKSPLPDGDGRSNTLTLQLAGTDVRLALAHMNLENIQADMTAGREVEAGDLLGRTGCTWDGRKCQHADPHLHVGLSIGDIGVSCYPLIVESYFRTYQDSILPVAGGFGFTMAGGDYLCDGSRSVARPGRRIVRWRWRLHDGREVEGAVARATYGKPGAFVEELIVTADDGCEDCDFLHVRAYAPGKIRCIARGWLHTSPCRGGEPGTPVTLWPRLGEVQSASVDFGDGSAAEPLASEMAHVYKVPGRYTIAVQGRGPGDVALPAAVAVGDRCEATASPPGHVVSGGQVLGCDWPWANSNRNFASWHSHYPANPAQQHGVRFEGEYVPIGSGGAGGGIPRIYEWALNVTDPQKTCDYSLFSEIPPQTKCPGPTIKSPPTDVPCSYIPDSGNSNPVFRVMYSHIHLTKDDVPGLESLETPAEGFYLPDYPKTSTPSPQVAVVSKQKPCTECQIGTVSCFDVGFDPLLITSWESEIFVAAWKEMADYAGTNTCAAMAKSYEMVLNHEQKHHDQFMDLYAKPLMDAIDKLNATYHFEYCSLAFDEPLQDRAVVDAAENYKQRRDKVDLLVESWDAYQIAANALDDADYPLLDQAMPTDIRIKD